MDEQSVRAAARERGRSVMREVLGEDYMEIRDSTTSPLNSAVRAMSEEFVYGDLWERSVLDRRTRSLVTLAMLCALNRPNELRIHLIAARRNGLTAEEIAEVFTQASAYCGFPAAIDGLRIVAEVLGHREVGPSAGAASDRSG